MNEKNKKRKLRRQKKLLQTVFVIAGVLLFFSALFLLLLFFKVNHALDTGTLGEIEQAHNTPKEYEGKVINILLVGVYREEKTTPQGVVIGPSDQPLGTGLTDMIVYIHYNLEENKASMVQIPRDTYVGQGIGGDGKINSVLMHGENQQEPINNLVSVISNQYKLPVDRYILVDMEALLEMVKIFNGIKVYVPQPMNNLKGSSLEQGWQWLDSDACKFFLRNREGEGFGRADIDRLVNQRHFYAALFRRLQNLTAGDLLKLLPVFEHYAKTDFTFGDLYSIANKARTIQGEQVVFCIAPGATSTSNWIADPAGKNETYYILDKYDLADQPGFAQLLNQYFRLGEENIPPEKLEIPVVDIPDYVPRYSVSVSTLGSVLEQEGGENIDVEHQSG